MEAKASKKSVLKAMLRKEGIKLRAWRRSEGMDRHVFGPGRGKRPLNRHQPGKRPRRGRKGSKRGRVDWKRIMEGS